MDTQKTRPLGTTITTKDGVTIHYKDWGEGRPVTLSTCHVYRVKDGKIWRHATYSDRTWRFDKPGA